MSWGAYGTFTGLHLFVNPNGLPVEQRSSHPFAMGYAGLNILRNSSVSLKLRLAMRIHGVELSAWPGGRCSAAHDDCDLDDTLAALRAGIRMLREEGEIA